MKLFRPVLAEDEGLVSVARCHHQGEGAIRLEVYPHLEVVAEEVHLLKFQTRALDGVL